jgi:hypothetical protein
MVTIQRVLNGEFLVPCHDSQLKAKKKKPPLSLSFSQVISLQKRKEDRRLDTGWDVFN